MTILAITCVCFTLRALPRAFLPHAYCSDTYFHLFCADAIREYSFRIPRKLPRVLLRHEYTYPYLYAWTLALLPLRFRLWAERLTPAVFDTGQTLLVYSFTEWANRRFQVLPQGCSPELVALLFALSPALLRPGSGPRAYNGSPRVVGQFLCLAFILSGFYAGQEACAAAWIVAVVCAALVFLTSKFCLQAVVFFAPAFLVGGIWFPPLLLVAGFTVAWVLSRGHAWAILLGHIRHSVFYFRHLQQVYLHPRLRSTHARWRATRLMIWRLRHGQFRGFINEFLTEPYFLRYILIAMPHLFLAPAVLLRGSRLSSLDHLLIAWTAAATICFILTKRRAMAFLGEGERYLEYALYPSLLLAVASTGSASRPLAMVYLAYCVCAALYFQRDILRRYRPLHDDYCATTEAFIRLNSLPQGNLLPIGPYHWQALARSKHFVLTHGANIDSRLLPAEEFLFACGRYPMPSERFEEILRRYQISYVLSDSTYREIYATELLQDQGLFERRTRSLFRTATLECREVVPMEQAGKD